MMKKETGMTLKERFRTTLKDERVRILYVTLREMFEDVLNAECLKNDPVEVFCRSLSAEEAIGTPKRKDYPILTGKDVMIQAEYRGFRGQAFTDAPSTFSGTLEEILNLDIVGNAHERGLFIAVMNAVLCSLGRCGNTVHCRTDGPERCAAAARSILREQWPNANNVTLVGYQPALLQMLAESGYDTVRVLDLNPANIGQERFGITIEDGQTCTESAISSADLILCTGSTLSNGTIVDYIGLDKVVFYGITAAGAAELLGLRRLCFADCFPA